MNRLAWRVGAWVSALGIGCVAIAQAQRGFEAEPLASEAPGPDLQAAAPELLPPDAAVDLSPLETTESTAVAPAVEGDPFATERAAARTAWEAPGEEFSAQADDIPPAEAAPPEVEPAQFQPPEFPAGESPLGEPQLGEPQPLPAVDEPASLDNSPLDSGSLDAAQPITPPEPAARRPSAPPRRLPSASNTSLEKVAGLGRPGPKTLEGPQSPALTVTKKAPAEIQVGKPAAFEVTVRNVGAAPATRVEVRDEVPVGARLHDTSPPATTGRDGELIWSLGTLAPGDEVRVVMQIIPEAEGELGSVATATFSAEASARSIVTRPRLEVAVTGPERVHAGDEAVYVVRVTNTGTGLATGVMLEDALPEAFEHPAGAQLEYEVGQLRPNESHDLELRVKAIKPGAVNNLVVARGDGELLAEARTELEVVAPAIQLGVNGPKRRFLDRQATYVVSISNPGTAPAREVALTTYLPEGLQFVSANNQGQYDPRTRAVHWLLDELPQGETGAVELTTMPISAGNHTLVVEGQADRGVSDKLEQPVVVEGVAAILFEVVDVDDPIEIGGQTSYEIRVTNQGSKAATNVQLAAILPPEMKALDAEGPARHQLTERRVIFEPLPRLAPKADATYRVRVEALSAADARVHIQVRTDEMQSEVTKEESTQIYADE